MMIFKLWAEAHRAGMEAVDKTLKEQQEEPYTPPALCGFETVTQMQESAGLALKAYMEGFRTKWQSYR